MTDFYSLDFNTRDVDIIMEVKGDYDDLTLLNSSKELRKLELFKSQGRFESDILRLQDPFNFIISNSLFDALNLQNISGWDTYEVVIEGLKKRNKGFRVTSECSEILSVPNKSGFVTGLRFNINTWDGSDFFIPNGTMRVLCTEKAKKIIDSFAIKSIELVDIKKVEWYNAI